MDQDDLLTRDAIETLYNAAIKYNADVAIGQSKRFYMIKLMGRTAKIDNDIIIDHKQFMDQYYHGFFGWNIFPVSIWNKLYKRSFLDSIPEPPLVGMYHEDLNYNLHILPLAERIVWLSNLTHYYRWGGFTTRPIKDLDKVALSGYRIKIAKITELHLPDFEYSTAVELLNYMNSFFYQVGQYDGKECLKDVILSYMGLEEIQTAIQTVKLGNYRNGHVNFMLNGDYEGLISYEMNQVYKNQWKAYIKKIATKFV